MFELWIIALVIIAVGVVGTMLPGLPGMPLILGGIVLFAIGTELRVIGFIQLALFVVLAIVGLGLNYLGNLLGARTFGASRMGMLGAVVGLVLGLILMGPFGLIVGPLIGAVGFELMRGRELAIALRSGVGVLVGYVFGALAEVVIAVGMAAWFVWSTWGTVMAAQHPGML
jgi:uncharacterized protein